MRILNVKNKNQGFTLVEMMVAIAVFSIVMITATSALLNVIDANAKARSIKTAVNNITLALEGISKDMRMGTDYVCGTLAGTLPTNVAAECPLTGGAIIGYKTPKLNYNNYVYYQFSGNQISECLNENDNDCPGNFKAVTSADVDIQSVTFYVFGVQTASVPAPNKTQPRVVITIKGEAGSKEKTKTKFDLQTSVSQIIRP